MVKKKGLLRDNWSSNMFLFKDIDSHYLISFLGIRFKIKHKAEFNYKAANDFGLNKDERKPKLIVSMTSHLKRINFVYLTINTLLQQTLKPDKIILWLSYDEFPKGEAELPQNLLELKKFGLTIDWCENIKSYKKLIPALRKYPNDIIVTVDDDVYYDSELLNNLYNAYLKDKNNIYTRRSVELRLKDNTLKYLSSGVRGYKNDFKPTFFNQLMGGSGCLYPPHSLHKDVLNIENIKSTLPTHDDVYFWGMAILNKTKIQVVDGFNVDLNFIQEVQESALMNINKDGKSGISLEGAYKIMLKKYPTILSNLIESQKEEEKLLTKDNIEVIILSGNRLNMLKDSVESIMSQTVVPSKITVINNTDKDDGTEKYVENLQKEYPNLYYYRQERRVSVKDNLETAKKLVTREYVIFFHDDDILHPQYIQYALDLINKYKNVDLICSLCHSFENKDEILIKPFTSVKYKVYDSKIKFARHVYSAYCTDGTSLIFPNLIYRAENLDKLIVDRERFGRPADKPLVMEFIQDGLVIQIFENDMLFYRNHKGQDTHVAQKSPDIKQIAEHNLFFKKLLGTSFISKLIIDMFSIKWVNSLYKWGNLTSEISYSEFLKYLYKRDAISIISLFWYIIPTKLILKPFNYLSHRVFTKRIKEHR